MNLFKIFHANKANATLMINRKNLPISHKIQSIFNILTAHLLAGLHHPVSGV